MTNLKKIIAATGLKQKWIAKHIGVGETMFSKYVNGERTAPKDTIRKLAKLLGVSQKSLIG